MSTIAETFFTVIGCMDGRVQKVMAEYGQRKFGTAYPDTITEAGLVGIISQHPTPEFLAGLDAKIQISLRKHRSAGILIDGHEHCAGDPVAEYMQKDHIRRSVTAIKELISNTVPVYGVYVKPDQHDVWQVEEVDETLLT